MSKCLSSLSTSEGSKVQIKWKKIPILHIFALSGFHQHLNILRPSHLNLRYSRYDALLDQRSLSDMDRIRGECFDFSEKAEKVLEENEEVLSEVEKHNLKLLAYETRTCYKGIDMKVFTYVLSTYYAWIRLNSLNLNLLR